MSRSDRVRSVACAAGRAWDVWEYRARNKRAAERRATYLERALCRYFRLGVAVAALESET